MLTLQLTGPIQAVRLVGDGDQGGAPATSTEEQPPAEHVQAALEAERSRLQAEMEQEKTQLTQACRAVNRVMENLDALYRDTLANHRTDIAKLAVEIARKILMVKIGRGDYNIQAVIEEALKRAPTRQGIVIRLNPGDVPHCQQLQQGGSDSPFAALEFVADWSVGRGECLIETPKGIVKSFIDEHLERIGEALQKVE